MYNDTHTLATVVKYPEFPVPFASTWLKQHGYKTYFLASGGRRSWESYRNMAAAFVANGQFDVARDDTHPFWRQSANPIHFFADDYMDRASFVDAKRVLDDARGERFLLILWNYDTHFPFYPEETTQAFDERDLPPLARRSAEKRSQFHSYLHSIRGVDALIGDFY